MVPGPLWTPVDVANVFLFGTTSWVGAQSGLGPIWALMGPYGPSWTGLGGLGRFRILSVNFP